MDKQRPHRQHTGRGAYRSECMHCAFRKSCLPAPLSDAQVREFEQIVVHPPLVRADTPLQLPGNPPHSVFAIRAGAIKTFMARQDGEEQMTGLRLAGDVVGLENLGGSSAESGMQTLQHTLLCRIPITRLAGMLARMPVLQHRVFEILSNDIRRELDLIREVAGTRADRRLAYLLLDLGARISRNGGSATHFELPIRYRDVADYLGLAHETVSRLFKRLENTGVVRMEGRQVQILNMRALRQLAGDERLSESLKKRCT